jgi:hypothetical protein
MIASLFRRPRSHRLAGMEEELKHDVKSGLFPTQSARKPAVHVSKVVVAQPLNILFSRHLADRHANDAIQQCLMQPFESMRGKSTDAALEQVAVHIRRPRLDVVQEHEAGIALSGPLRQPPQQMTLPGPRASQQQHSLSPVARCLDGLHQSLKRVRMNGGNVTDDLRWVADTIPSERIATQKLPHGRMVWRCNELAGRRLQLQLGCRKFERGIVS